MRVRVIGVLVLALGLAGCLQRVTERPVVVETLSHSLETPLAVQAAAEGLADAGLELETPTATIVQSAWSSPIPPVTRLAPWRRFKVSVRVDPAAITVRPIAEECDAVGCTRAPALEPEEAALTNRAVESIQSRLDARTAMMRPAMPSDVAVQRQAARDPEAPRGMGPVVIPTRMGPTTVSAGYDVEVELVSGARVTGRIAGVSADGIAVELKPGDEIILWAGDIAALRIR